jgi:agmatinase
MPFDPNAAAPADSGVFGLSDPPERCRVRLIPVPFEATTSYGGGTSRGPAAILEASKQVDLFDRETGRPYEAGIFMEPASREIARLNASAKKEAAKVIAAAGVVGKDPRLVRALDAVNRASEKVNDLVHAAAGALLDDGRLVGVVGGDHATPYGLIRAVSERRPGVGVLHIDAHADLRDAYEGFAWSHASIMFNVARRLPGVARIVQVGIRDFCEQEADFAAASKGRVRTHYDADLAADKFGGTTWDALCARIVKDLPREVYVSFDIDGLDPALCPHTGTPVAGGLSFQEANRLLGAVVRSGRRIVGFDLNEVAPGADDDWDANVGARVLYKLVGWALKSEGKPARRRA